MSQFSWKSA